MYFKVLWTNNLVRKNHKVVLKKTCPWEFRCCMSLFWVKEQSEAVPRQVCFHEKIYRTAYFHIAFGWLHLPRLFYLFLLICSCFYKDVCVLKLIFWDKSRIDQTLLIFSHFENRLNMFITWQYFGLRKRYHVDIFRSLKLHFRKLSFWTSEVVVNLIPE